MGVRCSIPYSIYMKFFFVLDYCKRVVCVVQSEWMFCNIFGVYNWRAGASQPSRTTGTIFLYRPSGAHFTYAHAPNLRETPTRHVYPLPFERIRGLGNIMASVVETGEEWETRLSKGRRSRYIGSSVCLQTPPKRQRHA